MFGRPPPNTGEGVVTADAANSAAGATQLRADLEALTSGRAYYGQKEVGGPLEVIQWPAGGLGLDDSLQPSISVVNGERRVVYLKGEPVRAAALVIPGEEYRAISPSDIDAATLRAGLDNGSPAIAPGEAAGYVFRNPATGQTRYGVIDPATRQMFFTETNPWKMDPLAGVIDGLAVFSLLVDRLTDEKGNASIRPIANAALVDQGAINAGSADPLMLDTPISPDDLLALVADGTVRTLGPTRVEEYRQRLEAAERRRRLDYRKDEGGLSRLGVGVQEATTQGGGGDLRSSILDGMDSIRQVTQELFAGKSPASKEAGPPELPKMGTVPGLFARPPASPPPSPSIPAPSSPPATLSPASVVGTVSGAAAAATAAGVAAGQAAAEAAKAGALLRPPKPPKPFDPRNTPRSGVLE